MNNTINASTISSFSRTDNLSGKNNSDTTGMEEAFHNVHDDLYPAHYDNNTSRNDFNGNVTSRTDTTSNQQIVNDVFNQNFSAIPDLDTSGVKLVGISAEQMENPNIWSNYDKLAIESFRNYAANGMEFSSAFQFKNLDQDAMQARISDGRPHVVAVNGGDLRLVNADEIKPGNYKTVDLIGPLDPNSKAHSWYTLILESPEHETLHIQSRAASTDINTDKAVQAESKSNKALYAQLLAGSLSAILGAVLVAVAKTHQEGSDQSVDGIGDVAEPDYATEAERAADAAEQAWRNEFMDPDVWGKGHVDKDGVSDVTGTTNPNFVIDYGSDINNPQYTTTLTDEGKAALAEIRDKAATQRMSELKEEYQNEVAERQAYNEGLKDINAGGREGADHDAMVGIGATLIGLGTLSTMLLAGNRHVKHSHQKQAESGNPAQHGAFVRGFEQNILRVKA
jgi:hypothetical protein